MPGHDDPDRGKVEAKRDKLCRGGGASGSLRNLVVSQKGSLGAPGLP